MENIMANRLGAIRIGAALVIVAAVGLPPAAATIDVTAASAKDFVAPIGAAPQQGEKRTGDESASLANAVDSAKPAVIGVRAKRRLAVGGGEPVVSPPPDGQHSGAFPGRRAISVGSGFFVTSDAYAVTNNHVIEGSETVQIIADDQKTYKAKVVGADPQTDLALLKVEGRSDFASVKFADKSPRVGDRIFAVGNPYGLGGTVTGGIVSAQDRSIASDDHSAVSKDKVGGSNPYEDLIQIDASINRGNSGGPTFDAQGNVIGVNTVIFSPTGGSIGIAFAIPAEIVKAVVAQLMENGSVRRGWLGAQFQQLTPSIAEVLGLKEAHGALVTESLPDGPAMNGSIAAGDVIESINGEAIKDKRDLLRKLIGLPPGIPVNVGVFHDGMEETVAVTPSEPPITKEADANGARAAASATLAPASDDLGLMLTPAPEEPGTEHRGVLVIGIDPTGRAADLGVEIGDIILEAGGKPVQAPADIGNALDVARGAGHHAFLMLLKSGDAMRFVAVPVDPA
jgi:serine protease Do